MARRDVAVHSCVFFAGLLTLGCEGKTRDTLQEDQSGTPESEPLDLSIDRVDISHGGLRVTATMHGGSADVWVTLGDDCKGREVGGGMATPSSLVWTLGEDDLAGALACDLEVIARTATSSGYVLRRASVAVSAEMRPSPSQEPPPLPSLSRSDVEMEVVFAGGSAEETPSFVLPHRDFARSVLSSRPLRFGSWSFDPSVWVGGVALETEPVDISNEAPPAGGDGTETEPSVVEPGVITMPE